MIFLVNLDLKKLDIHDGCLLLLITNKAWPAERPLAPPGPFTGQLYLKSFQHIVFQNITNFV